MEYKNKKVLVCGLAKSGIYASKILKKSGAFVTVQDLKNKEKIKDIYDELSALGIEFYLGKNPDAIVDKMDLVVVSPGIPCDLPFFEIAEKNNIPVISELELGYRLSPCPCVAITGTNGKTTTTSLVGEIIKNVYKNTQVVGNIGTPYTQIIDDITENDFAVIEVSSFQLEKIDTFKPKVSAVLNITPDHLNRHKTLENYILAKEKIFLNQDENDFVVLNYDDEVCRKMADKTKARAVFFSRKEKVEGVYADEKSIYINLFGQNKKVIDIDDMIIFGNHNVENAMAAILIAFCVNISLETIVSTLKTFRAVEHRIEYVTTINDVEYYNDSKGTNPDAAIKSIEAMKRPVVLIGGGYDKKSDFTQWVELFEGRVKLLILIGEVKDQIAQTCDKVGFDKYIKTDTLQSAVDLAYKNAQEGDCVLLSPACASWDMFESYEQRGKLFKEYVLNKEK